ncbi:hypothetical protein Pla110_44430 [Polystyrenella longa]|uniref:Uncharacterized protein n=1 Tax=Polystyrenella longa TaxID=2528007 RepID=A0A518CTY0_9PLAN|nr:hypothetical protein [Polystyrenella longa]QDU82682.1 hypothetical protein Pla110_44430 [Polystyrenella longa]
MTSADYIDDDLFNLEDFKKEEQGLAFSCWKFVNVMVILIGLLTVVVSFFVQIPGIYGFGNEINFVIGVALIMAGQYGNCLQDIRFHCRQETIHRQNRQTILVERKKQKLKEQRQQRRDA